MRTVIHCNGGLKHQVVWAAALQDGFRKHGIEVEVSLSPDTEADTHIVLGPWFALRQWRDADTLYLDRAYWGDPDRCSLHWLADGEKHFTRGNPHRHHPAVQAWKHGRRAIVLCDYGMTGEAEALRARPHFERVTIRRHPTEAQSRPLADDLADHDIAIGRRSTALIDAAIAGLAVITPDPASPVAPVSGITVRDISRPDREQWLRDLAWHNWHISEITRGEAWEFLRSARRS